ncbi:glycosyltransferase family 2 protein [Vibrio vulnificus]|uniref:glycosyltransferase family 2 protein n=1 Tax=Vibrio vulnificus TaxID=672 RepID=UPI0005F152DE|nr:glycosyltransferase family 2 protein [Vibrio vulnificus]OJI57961.1 Rhamnosyltransferase WbbL [Vibrio fluvialis]EGQ7759707.1 glycosyltransferase family 2 protein [Vibrio vulnificus]EGQ7964043.1 glycosyltransferase family 2 protein [Vibrio vulnificus]EGR1512287.1 glycosyltransferase family 2 protein [Vibrio vulnificus]EHH2450014.1 glycosyltransferase family 2 protein [Vibrio vulnificus]
MRIIISTVSHNHYDMIAKLNSLAQLAKHEDITVICRDNVGDSRLQEYCFRNEIIYIQNRYPCGYAVNNNLNFVYYNENLHPRDDDYFVLFNPDVELASTTIHELRKSLAEKPQGILAGNLYLDENYTTTDDNIRRYPRLYQFAKTYLLGNRSTMIDRKDGLPEDGRYWASGAFIAICTQLYKKLGGLDERYYMYCEDIDFCYRASKAGIPVKLVEDVKAIHWRQRDSKKMFSRFFVWHVSSVLRYCFSRKKVAAKRSQLYVATRNQMVKPIVPAQIIVQQKRVTIEPKDLKRNRVMDELREREAC